MTSCSNTVRQQVAATNRFVCTGEFLWKSLLLQQNFVTTTSSTDPVWFDFLPLVAATKFRWGDKDFHKNSPDTRSDLSWFVAVTCLSPHHVAATSCPTCSHGVICRRDVLLQLVALCVPTLKPLYNSNLFITATFFCPQGGHCREAQQ